MPIDEGYAHLLFIGGVSRATTCCTENDGRQLQCLTHARYGHHTLTERRTWDRHALKFKHDIFEFKFKDRAPR